MRGASPTGGEPAAALPQAEVPDRYGRGKASRRDRILAWSAGGVAVVIAVVVLLWISIDRLSESITAQEVGFEVAEDEASVDVIFDLTMPRGREAVCTLEALDARYGQVGLLDEQVGPYPDRVNRVTITVTTSAPPVTGLVRSCHLVE